MSLDETQPDRPYSFDDITLCLEEQGSVIITAVSPIEPTGGLRVVDFSVLPEREGDTINYVADNSQRLVDAGFPTQGQMKVDSVCPDEESSEGGVYILGIEVTRTDRAVGTARGFRVTYEAGDGSRTEDYPLGIVLCSELWLDEAAQVRSPGCEVESIDMG